MTANLDIIALCLIAGLVSAGGLYLITRPVTPSKHEEREKAMLATLERLEAWIRENPCTDLTAELAQKLDQSLQAAGVARSEILSNAMANLIQQITKAPDTVPVTAKPRTHLIRQVS